MISNDVMIWGDALIKAYSFEKDIAIYPRVVIDPSLVGELNLALHPDENSKKWIRQDKDGLFYVELFNECLKNADIFAIRLFDVIDNQLAQHNNNRKICQKWIWLASYIKERLLELGNTDIQNDEQ